MMYYLGCKKIELIWHGEWSDPELRYKNRLYNYYDIEDILLNEYKERNNIQEINDSTEFENWIKSNKMLIYEILDNASTYLHESYHILASKPISNFGSLVIIDYDDIYESLRVALSTPDYYKKSRPLKIYYNNSGDPYFNYYGKRQYIKDFIKNN